MSMTIGDVLSHKEESNRIADESVVQEALDQIVQNKEQKALNYAVEYARLGRYMNGHDLYVQVLYVLNNMTHWRGDTAKEVRAVLKQYQKTYKPGSWT